MYEYMYVYVTSCMSTFIFAWSHIFMHIYVYVCMYACMYVWVYECMRDEHTWLCQCRHAQLLCLCLCLCLLVSSLLLPFFSKWVKERKGMERKGKQSKGMEWELLCSVLYILLDTCLARSSTSTNNERSQPPPHPISNPGCKRFLLLIVFLDVVETFVLLFWSSILYIKSAIFLYFFQDDQGS